MSVRRRVRLLALVFGLAGLALTPAALADEWMQVSCQNPNGSSAPSDGWSTFSTGDTFPSGTAHSDCNPGNPMAAGLDTENSLAVGTSENLQYSPPVGSTLIGGSLQVALSGDGHGPNGSGVAGVYEPAYQFDNGDLFFNCASWNHPGCSSDTPDNASVTPDAYVGALVLPPGRGGTLYVSALCQGYSGGTCDQGGIDGKAADVQVFSAHLLLRSDAAPQAAHFAGSALQRGARGTAHLVLTATDPGGPGVYQVTASVDGMPVWTGTPNTNGGQCVPVGTDPATGALMFDWRQPCPGTEVADVPVPTHGLPDGSHELTVSVTDAAGNRSTVFDQRISTSNPQLTPVPSGGHRIHAQFVISWHWQGLATLLRSISVRRLPRSAQVAVRCAGRRCPRLRLHSADFAGVRRLLRSLGGKRFHAGNRLLITVTEPGRVPERIELVMRDNAMPRARLLKR